MSADASQGRRGASHRFEADGLLMLTTVIAAAGWIFSKEALAGMPPLIFVGLRFAIELFIAPSEPFSVVVPESAR